MQKKLVPLSIACLSCGILLGLCVPSLLKTKARTDANGFEIAPDVKTFAFDQAKQADLQNLESRVTHLEAVTSKHAVASLSADDKNWNFAQTDLGPMILYIASAEPYLDGYRLKLRIGNPYAVTPNGCKLSFTWGKHTKTQDIFNDLKIGRFTDIDVSLTPATAQDLKFVEVALELSEMSFPGPSPQ